MEHWVSETSLSSLQNKLAGQIVDLLRRSGLDAGARIQEARLASTFGVSRSPVRSALALLESKKIVRKEPNRGYFLCLSSEDLGQKRLQLPQSEEEELYRRIASARIANELPDQLSEADLLRTYDVKRGLLLRVLNRLAEDGLVQRSPGHGWRFLPALLTEDAHDESYRFRLVIEPSAFDEPTFAVDRTRLAAARAEHEALMVQGDGGEISAARMFQVNAHFHEMLAEFSNNRYILQAVQGQNRLRRLLEIKGSAHRDRVRQSCSEHLEIIDALERDDRQLAQLLLKRHITIASRLKLAFER